MSTTATRYADTGVETWQIDPAHTQVEFEVKHMMFARVRGRFEGVAGSLQLGDDGHAEAWRVEAAIDAASINTGTEQRDAHLRSPDFFDVMQFPELKFTSRAVRRLDTDRLSVTGDLTIREVTREVELEVTETGRGTDPWGNARAGFSARAVIDRRDFGLTWNQALETGGVLVGTEVKITIEIQAILFSD